MFRVLAIINTAVSIPNSLEVVYLDDIYVKKRNFFIGLI